MVKHLGSGIPPPSRILTRVNLDPTTARGITFPILGHMPHSWMNAISIGHHLGNCVFQRFSDDFVSRRKQFCGETIPHNSFQNPPPKKSTAPGNPWSVLGRWGLAAEGVNFGVFKLSPFLKCAHGPVRILNWPNCSLIFLENSNGHIFG